MDDTGIYSLLSPISASELIEVYPIVKVWHR